LFAGEGWQFAANSVIGKLLHVGDKGGYFDPAGDVTPMFVKDLTRVVLLTVFTLLGVLVWKAFRGKQIVHGEEPK
jgi:hypothetical protein